MAGGHVFNLVNFYLETPKQDPTKDRIASL